MSDLEGQQLGNYSLTRKIGEGAFAEVYVGEHVRLNTLAAIKVLHTRLTRFESGEFLTEARTVANLDHRNIVRVLDFDVRKDIPFLVLEYAPNGSLRQRHPRGSQPPLNTIVSYVKQIAAGLQYAHDKKLIHRDVKPENMLLKLNDELLLSDFGLATIARSTQSLSLDRLEMAGTPYYMAPEQIQGRTRRASDQYALGIVVYEWISGSPPFTGSRNEMYAQHQFAVPPPLHEKVPGFPPSIEQVIMKALAKEPENRYPRVKDFADALEQAVLQQALVVETSAKSSSNAGSFSEEAPTLPPAIPANTLTPDALSLPPQISVPVVPASHISQTATEKLARHKIPRRKVLTWGIVVGTGALAVTSVTYIAEHVFSFPHSDVSTNLPQHPTSVTTQPFGTLLYHPYSNPPSKVYSVAWSHDGRYIASGWDDNIARVLDATTGKIVSKYSKHTNFVKSVAWSPSPNSTLIATGSKDKSVRIWNAISGIDVLTPPYTGHSASVRSVAWSPDGTLIASGSEDHTVRVWNATTGSDIFNSHSTSTGHKDLVFSVAWSPDGKYIASASADRTVKVWNIQTGQNIFTYQKHQQWVRTVAWSHDGKHIASGSEDMTVRVWNATTGSDILPSPYKGHKAQVYCVAWSPDDKHIASGAITPDNTVQVWNATTGGQTQTYRQHHDQVWAVSWSPDGKYITSGSWDSTVQVWWAI
jgi:eukaryotic-like serine/threonine-protein kinase